MCVLQSPADSIVVRYADADDGLDNNIFNNNNYCC